jgi:hypothetical protein
MLTQETLQEDVKTMARAVGLDPREIKSPSEEIYAKGIFGRFQPQPVTEVQKETLSTLRLNTQGLVQVFLDSCPKSPELTRAINKIEEALMLATASVSRHGK